MLKQRVLTALVLGPLALWGLLGLNGAYFALFCGAIIVLGGWEWSRLCGFKAKGQMLYPLAIATAIALLWLMPISWPLTLWAALAWWLFALLLVISYPHLTKSWSGTLHRAVIGLLVLIPTWCGFILLRQAGVNWLLYVLVLVWAADIGAYFAGRAFGKRKLAPSVSPGKSWAGVFGGLAATLFWAFGIAIGAGANLQQTGLLMAITVLITLASVLGDLTESMFKREAGLKDSSQLLPGHGGILDRIDSLTSAIPLFALFGLPLVEHLS